MLTQTKTQSVTAYSLFFEDGNEKIMYMTKSEFAGFKRSKLKKKVLTIKKVLEITTTIKTKIF